MKKKFPSGRAALLLAFLFAFVTVCAPITSLAASAPRLPAQTGTVTDVANVLSSSVIADVKTLAQRMNDKMSISLYVATAYFLDGEAMESYGQKLFAAWGLGSKDCLVIISTAEDACTTVFGSDIQEHMASDTSRHMISTYMTAYVAKQDYDGALRAYLPQMADYLAKQYSVALSLSGLFGTVAETAKPAATAAPDYDYSDWWADQTDWTAYTGNQDNFTRENGNGMSIGKLLLIAFVLMMIFGGSKKGKNRSGCGCSPIGWLIGGIGLGGWFANKNHGPHHGPRSFYGPGGPGFRGGRPPRGR